MLCHILPHVKNSHDLQCLALIPVIDHVRPGSQLPITRADIDQSVLHCTSGQFLTGIADGIGISVSLIQAPMFGRVIPYCV